MSSDLNNPTAGDKSRPGLAIARRVAEEKKLLDSDGGQELFAFYDEESDRIAVFEYDSWEGVFLDDIDIYGNCIWSAPRSELAAQPVSVSN